MSILQKIPKTIEFYPHVAEKIDACWDSPEAAEYLGNLLLKDRFRDRQGFNISVWFELKALLESSQYNTVDFSKENTWAKQKTNETHESSNADHDVDDFQEQLKKIHALVKLSRSFNEVMPEIEPAILYMLRAVRMTVFQCARNGKEIVATFKSSREKQEIRVPFSPTSIAGYVALSQNPVLIKNLYQDDELKAIHPKLQFDRTFSEKSGLKHRTMVCVPIKANKVMLGVLQIINRSDGAIFSLEDVKRIMLVAQMIGSKFHLELKSTQGPYDKLIQQSLISLAEFEELKKKAKQSRQSITQLLSERGISAAEIGVSLEHYYQVPYMGYQDNLTLPKEFFEHLQLPYLRKNLWLPIGGDSNEVVILLDDPSDNEKIIEIQRVVNSRNYIFRVGTAEDILRYLDEDSHSIGKANLFEVISQMDEKQEESIASPSEIVAGESASTVLEDSSPIVQLVNQMIAEAARLGGSDIHIEPSKNKQPGVVRLRVDGVCRELFSFPGNNVEAVIARIKVMSRLDLSQRRVPQDGKCKLKVNGKELELRVATIPTVNGESVVLRLLAGGGALPLSKLNLAEKNMQGILELTAKPHGLFLVVGPTGSGKTTSLHAVLAHLNKPERKIWTAEDPVEITQPGLQQVQINNKIGFNFMAAMRAFLRADPDCILIGEMRDQETASIGIEASLTGHLVLSTLHTNSAPETITRLLDLGMEPINFSDALLGVLAQRLIRTLCPKCKQEYRPTDKEIEKLIKTYGADKFPELGVKAEDIRLYQAKGCEECGNSGYRGRTGIHELLVGTKAMKKLIYENAPISSIREQAMQDNMRTLLQDGVYKIIKGDTDYQQLMKVASE